MSLNHISWKQLEYGIDSLKVYDGGSKYSDLIKSMTGVYKNKKVSGPRNQIFVRFETISKVSYRGFKASIHENGIIMF